MLEKLRNYIHNNPRKSSHIAAMVFLAAGVTWTIHAIEAVQYPLEQRVDDLQTQIDSFVFSQGIMKRQLLERKEKKQPKPKKENANDNAS